MLCREIVEKRNRMERWCTEQLENLKIRENRLSALSAIHIRLHDAKYLESIVTKKLLSAPEIYDCLEPITESGNNEQIDLATDILNICMSNLSISHTEIPTILERALKHHRPNIRALALRAILKELRRQSGDEPRIELSDNLLALILDAMQHEETEVGIPALEILSFVLDEHLDKPFVKEALMQLLDSSDIIKCRAYELGVNLAKHSPASIQKVEFVLDRALLDLDNNDILLQVNVLEVFVSLTEQNHGLVYLERKRVFDILSARIESLGSKPINRLLIPAVMKFFGRTGGLQPQKIIPEYPYLMHCLCDCVTNPMYDMSVMGVAVDTFANLAQTNQGKLLMHKHYEPQVKDVFQSYAAQIKNLSAGLKNRLFQSLEVIYSKEGNVTPEISEILHTWFKYLAGGEDMVFFMDFYRNPFPDLKLSCLSFLKVVCTYKWGVRALKATAGFVEYLLDRSFEFDNNVKLAKYDIILLLANSDEFDIRMQTQFQTYINEGPYYVKPFMDIATEEN